MGSKLSKKMLRHLHLKETWIIFFILGIIMMNYPFIHIFYEPRLIFGIPGLVFYLYVGWFVSICVVYLFVKAIDLPEDDKGDQR